MGVDKINNAICDQKLYDGNEIGNAEHTLWLGEGSEWLIDCALCAYSAHLYGYIEIDDDNDDDEMETRLHPDDKGLFTSHTT